MDIKLEKKININSREKIVILFVLLILFLSCFFIYYLFTKESALLVPRERAIFYTAQFEPYQDVLVTRAIRYLMKVLFYQVKEEVRLLK